MTPGADPFSLLSAFQLTDSLFPSGRYTLSHGLEMFVESGRVHDAESLENVVRDYVIRSLSASEGVAVGAAHQATVDHDVDRLVDIDRTLHAMRLPREAWTNSGRVGRQLITTGRSLVDSEVLDELEVRVDAGDAVGSSAVVIGAVSAELGVDRHTAVLAELYAYAAGLVGAALRLMRLDHVAAQLVLRRLQPAIAEGAARALTTDYRDMEAFAPMIDVMQMQHERSRMRLFAS
ncbi:MAG: urease accessory protein UreF [Acidimicrobiales bacterium]